MYGGAVTIASCESEVALVRVSGTEILRNSNKSILVSSYYDEPAGVTKHLYCIFTFQAGGAITVVVDRTNSYLASSGSFGGNYSWNIDYYKYAA